MPFSEPKDEDCISSIEFCKIEESSSKGKFCGAEENDIIKGINGAFPLKNVWVRVEEPDLKIMEERRLHGPVVSIWVRCRYNIFLMTLSRLVYGFFCPHDMDCTCRRSPREFKCRSEGDQAICKIIKNDELGDNPFTLICLKEEKERFDIDMLKNDVDLWLFSIPSPNGSLFTDFIEELFHTVLDVKVYDKKLYRGELMPNPYIRCPCLKDGNRVKIDALPCHPRKQVGMYCEIMEIAGESI